MIGWNYPADYTRAPEVAVTGAAGVSAWSGSYGVRSAIFNYLVWLGPYNSRAEFATHLRKAERLHPESRASRVSIWPLTPDQRACMETDMNNNTADLAKVAFTAQMFAALTTVHHLDAAELSCGPAVRGGRPEPRRGAQVFHRHGLAHRGRRPRRAGRRSPGPASRRLPPPRGAALDLDYGGDYHFRLDGENHLWNPTTVTRLQHAVVQNDPRAYEEYARAINQQGHDLCTLRGLFELLPGDAVPLDEVEPAARSSSDSTPAPCRTARSAKRPTRPWRWR